MKLDRRNFIGTSAAIAAAMAAPTVMASGKPSSDIRPSELHHGHFTRNRPLSNGSLVSRSSLRLEPSAL